MCTTSHTIIKINVSYAYHLFDLWKTQPVLLYPHSMKLCNVTQLINGMEWNLFSLLQTDLALSDIQRRIFFQVWWLSE